MSFQTQKPKRITGPTSLEILVFQAGGQWFGLRSGRQIRLVSFGPGQLKFFETPSEKESGPVGFLTKTGASFPVYDLAYLLGLKSEPGLPAEGQLIQALVENQPVGFIIEQAQEIQRVPVPELRQIPAIINDLWTAPVVWAVWLRPDNTLIPLLDLAFIPAIQA
ncbi:MAG: chemotaxis protein CheW [Chloroflexi bacterium]|nr:chemotaxis protein CheW [Chloroflexota bacterium]OJW02658.1 MAG: hypothetical protein BGO39_33130 [Chloroflexi bacterium 54-19]